MFILVNFGYKMQRVFTIDCLAATLFDCIWATCFKELLKMYAAKQQLFAKEIQNHQKRIEKNEKRLEEVEVKLKEEADANPGAKKDDKKTAKKGGKEPVAGSPLEQEKMDLQKEVEESKTAITKYNEKLPKITELIAKANRKHAFHLEINEKVGKQQLFLELVDKSGQRKFIKAKLQSDASTFLTDKTTYYLCTVGQVGEEEEVEPFVIDGYPVRKYEQDAAAAGQQVFTLAKKEDKNKKGGKKK